LQSSATSSVLHAFHALRDAVDGAVGLSGIFYISLLLLVLRVIISFSLDRKASKRRRRVLKDR